MTRRTNPFEEIERVLDRMSQLGEEFEETEVSSTVAVDVEDRDDEFVVTADLPGFDTEDVDVELRDSTLSISASRIEESEEEEEGTYVRRERRERSLSRSVELPGPVDPDDVDATYQNGVLTVTLGKAEESGHSIDIE